jgi:beta-mannosidase
MEGQVQTFKLDQGWELRERAAGADLPAQLAAAEGWLAATVPGTVQQDLLAAGLIPDPFVGLAENEVQWIGEREWLYRCRFDLPGGLYEQEQLDFCCDGLDTIASVWLNGLEILRSDNQFVPHRTSTKGVLRPTGNELAIVFGSALHEGQAREAHYGKRNVWNGDASRVYVRKAGYNYGWDWGPCLLTVGPWREIRLEGYTARLADLHCAPEVAPDLRTAALPVTVEVEGGHAAGLEVAVTLHAPDGAAIETLRLPVAGDTVSGQFALVDLQLWWPRGHGEQPLYRLTATLLRGDDELDRRETRVGLRRLRLVHEAVRGEAGQSFLFEINNAPIFCGGYNWIPADSFPPRVTAEQYRAWVALAAEGNTAMLRVWGGGLYEDDAFYDACDELGILVWQDFMFACGIYSAHPEYLESVGREATAAVRRIRNHPSLVIWCGNNEDYQIAGRDYDLSQTTDLAASAFPAREIYERLLPEICARLDPSRPYWPGSPYGGANPNDPTIGDRHVWDVWHGAMAPYQDYPKYRSRFVSEFGMASTVGRAAIAEYAAPEERYAESRTFDHHLKAAGGQRRIAAYLADNLRHPADLDGYIYGTQLVQAEALAVGVRGWRREWRGPGQYGCSGALVWQLNDCWPVTSWAVVDYRLRPKPAFYVLKRAFALLTVNLAPAEGGVAAWAVNGGGAPVAATLHLGAWRLNGEQIGAEERAVTLLPYRATELGDFATPGAEPTIVSARLTIDGVTVSRASWWPEPYKYLDIPDPEIAIERRDDSALIVRTARPAKGVVLDAGAGTWFADNALDLFPDDPQEIAVRNLDAGEIGVEWLRG